MSACLISWGLLHSSGNPRYRGIVIARYAVAQTWPGELCVWVKNSAGYVGDGVTTHNPSSKTLGIYVNYCRRKESLSH